MRRLPAPCLLSLCLCITTFVATAAPAERVVVNDAGVLRWADDGSEVALFGVNYYAPHVVDYDHLKKLGLEIKPVIDGDLVHFSRMGLDTLRLHVFDCEISDLAGNLIDNEHLDLLDYLIAEAKKRGIYTVLTPIAWWRSPDSIGGFSAHYSMRAMTTDPEAWAAQRRYLGQFLNHVNRYTGVAYKDDPAIPVIELINEPVYPEDTDDAKIDAYIETLAEAVRATGCKKPIFYNGWLGKEAVVGASSIDGCTFGWYPSGLVAGHSLQSNYLPKVDQHETMGHPAVAGKAKVVYEFDAADIPGSHMYPAMARAFRSGGAQIATQFQYDPLPTAPFNSGWYTHYLNLVYAPNKAVSFIIAGEVFRRLPRGGDHGHYPESAHFGPFRVSYEEDLSEFANDSAFMYSNNTKTSPPSPGDLARIVGCGSSPVVAYEGTGAYFLDRLAPGAWQLEVYPDAVWIADPFCAAPSFDKEVSRTIWRTRKMTVALPDLGDGFDVTPVNGTEGCGTSVVGRTFPIRPGIYLLTRRGVTATPVSRQFVAPEDVEHPLRVSHTPAPSLFEGAAAGIVTEVASNEDPDAVLLQFRTGPGTFETMPMTLESAYTYHAAIPGDRLTAGSLEYGIVIKRGDDRLLFPGGVAGDLASSAYVSPPEAHTVFAASDTTEPVATAYNGPAGDSAEAEYTSGDDGKGRVLRMTATGFGEGQSCTSARVSAAPLRADSAAWPGAWDVVVRARALYPQTAAVEIGFVEDSGEAFGFEAPLGAQWSDIRLPVRDLRPLWGTREGSLRPEQLNELSLIYGTWLFPYDKDVPHGLEIDRIVLEPAAPIWRVPILSEDSPPRLFSADLHRVNPKGNNARPYMRTIGGMDPDREALRISVGGFGVPQSAVSFSNIVGEELAGRRATLATCDTMVVRARGPRPHTNAVEIVLTERDGSHWGTNVPLTQEWQAIAVPLTDLRFFAHWFGNPEGRGGEGDGVRPENVCRVGVCFGQWLYGEHADGPHAIDLQDITLERKAK